MSFFDELKRRKVFKVGAAYLVVAWLIVQMASIFFPTFAAPPWALRVFILVVFLGFPIALVFAWAFDFTPEGLKADAADRGNKRFLLFAAALVGLAFLWYFKGQPSYRDAVDVPQAAASPAAAPAPASTRKSIAVLPFVNMSADAGNQFFADGISEELLNVLVRVPDLGVASRTSSFAYKGREVGAPQIGRELKVSHILEGSVRKSGEQVRITAQLIDAANDRHVWSQTYDRKLDDIFAVQDEIANAIVAALRGSLADEAPAVKVKADTENMQAYELYLKARENFIARRDLGETVKMFERVVQLDPKFARGWEGLAATCSVAPSWGVRDRDYRALAMQAADRALELDAQLSMPWAVKAQATQDHWPIDFISAQAHFERAIAADPRNATAFLWRGIYWSRLGFFDKAIADLDRAIALEPGYLNATRHKAQALLFQGKEAEAFALFESGFEKGFVTSRFENFIAPMLARGHRSEALLLLGAEDMDRELFQAILKSLDHGQPTVPARALVQRAASRADARQRVIEFASPSSVYVMLGDFDAAAETDDTVTTAIVAWDRYPPGWRNSPGMKRKLERMGVVAYWRAKGFPPQCHPVGAKDFNCD
jgi:TolB-like protein